MADENSPNRWTVVQMADEAAPAAAWPVAKESGAQRIMDRSAEADRSWSGAGAPGLGGGAQWRPVTHVSCPNRTASAETENSPSPSTVKSCALTRSSPSSSIEARVCSSSSSESRPVFGRAVEVDGSEAEAVAGAVELGRRAKRQRRM